MKPTPATSTETPGDDPQPDTRSVQRHGPVPRAPHEHDESADSQVADNAAAREVGKAAHADLAQGRVDTDKGPVMDATYDRVSNGGADREPVRR